MQKMGKSEKNPAQNLKNIPNRKIKRQCKKIILCPVINLNFLLKTKDIILEIFPVKGICREHPKLKTYLILIC